MRSKIVLVFALFCCVIGVKAQARKWEGNWAGQIEVEGVPLRIMFKIYTFEGEYRSKMDVPMQHVKDMTVSSTSVKGKELEMTVDKIDGQFRGNRIDSNTVKGTWSQRGKAYPLTLTRVWGEWPKPKPQTPKPPYPYLSEDVKIYTSNGRIMVAGTLTKPDSTGVHPAIFLISGSGAQDRDGSIGDHHPFAILADRFTKMGFIVLRCDDRGAGVTKGSPDVLQRTTTVDLAEDVNYFVDFLRSQKGVDTNKIGLLGHSEGGIIAPMVAAKRHDIAFIVMLSAPEVGGVETNVFQNMQGLQQAKVPKRDINSYLVLHRKLLQAVIESKDNADFHPKCDSIVQYWKKHGSTKIARKIVFRKVNGKQISTFETFTTFFKPWWKYFLSYYPVSDLKKVHSNILALNGDKDKQVQAEPNLKLIQDSAIAAKTLKTQSLPGLNHLYQTCSKCTLPEYFTLEESFSPAALDVICEWLNLVTTKK